VSPYFYRASLLYVVNVDAAELAIDASYAGVQ